MKMPRLLTLIAFVCLSLIIGENVGYCHAKVRLRLISLECDITEDASTDEPYLKVGGRWVWDQLAGMRAGDEVDLRGVNPIRFHRSTTVKLYDRDGGIFDSDDLLGTLTVTRALSNLGEQTFNFSRDEALYILTYEVIP